MLKKYAQHAKIGRININMRCIEIKMVGDIDYTILRLTLT